MGVLEIPWASWTPSGVPTAVNPPSSVWLGNPGGQGWLRTEAPVEGGDVTIELVFPPGAAGSVRATLRNATTNTNIVPPLDVDGGTYVPGYGAAVPDPGHVGPWRPRWTVPAGVPLQLNLVFTSPVAGMAGIATISRVITTIPVDGDPATWDMIAGGTTATVRPAWNWAGLNGPWKPTAPAAGEVLAVRKAWTGPRTFTVPLRSDGGPLTVRITAGTGTATLVTVGGATDNGDGTLTIPDGVRCSPKWTATDGAKLEMTKPAGTITASFSPLYIETPVVPPTPPTITKLIPTSGPDTGGTLVDIVGTNLTGATAVNFGGTAGTGLTVDPSGNLATVTSPAHTAGPAPVTITTPAGTSAAETFTFEAPPPPGVPTLTGIDPTSGTAAGGTTVLLTGTNLAGTTGVDFGGNPATIITTTDTALLVTTPAHTAGTVDVTATDGTTTTDPLSFEYVPVVEPTYGPDVIANLVALLASELGVPVSSRRSPTATKDSDPSVVVRRTGGPSKGVASDNPTVTIEAWAPTTTESFQLLQSARMVVIEAAEQGRAGLRRYDEFAGPADLPDPSTTNPRHTLTASVVTRIE